jgi:hypothetical protein
MFNRPTTFVIGAGCSAEYRLPIGDGLKDQIADQLSVIGRREQNRDFVVISSRGSDEVLLSAIVQAGQRRGERRWDLAANAMAPGIRHASSIDRYLHLHRDDGAKVGIGKIAIARAILAAEQDSILDSDRIDLPSISNKLARKPHWLQELMFRLQEDVSLDRATDIFKNITIITFNYDRVIEHYLYHAVRELCGFDDAAAADVMSHLKIIHPYGKIGHLPWQKETGGALPFGHWKNLHFSEVIEAGSRLRTFTETVEDEELLASIRKAVQDAEQIVFLGFSFLKQNLDLLRPDTRSRASKIWFTTLGMSPFDVDASSGEITNMLNGTNSAELRAFKSRSLDCTAGAFMADVGNLLRS